MSSTALSAAQSAALANVAGLVSGVERVVRNAPTGGGEYLKFGKDGKWVFGAKANELTKDCAAILNVLSLQEGFVCWTDNDDDSVKNEKLGEVMAPVSEPIDPSTLEKHGFPWRKQQSIDVKFITGPYEGTQTKYATNSSGGLENLGTVMAEVLKRVKAGNPYFFPIVFFDEEHYQHKKWGKTYKPMMDIDGWADVDGNEEPGGYEPGAIENDGAAQAEAAAAEEEWERRADEEAEAARQKLAAEEKAKAEAEAAAKAEAEAAAKAEAKAAEQPRTRSRRAKQDEKSEEGASTSTSEASTAPRRRRR